MKTRPDLSQTEKRRFLRYGWLALPIGIAIVVFFLWRAEAPAPQPRLTASAPALSSGTIVPAVLRRETRPTLDPERFVGKARLAHQVAREIPDVLDRLYCYCECDKHMGHKSLLSCYTDGHAAT
jgi:hypothetical protein